MIDLSDDTPKPLSRKSGWVKGRSIPRCCGFRRQMAREIAYAAVSVLRNYRKDVTSWRPIDSLPISTSTYMPK